MPPTWTLDDLHRIIGELYLQIVWQQRTSSELTAKVAALSAALSAAVTQGASGLETPKE